MEETTPKTDLTLNEPIKASLNTAAGWAKFLAILGFVVMGLLIVMGFALGSVFGSLLGDELDPGFPTFLFSVIYIIIALIYFFPILYLFRFATFIKKGLRDSDQGSVETAFANLKSHYTFIGIMTIIVFGLYLVIGLFAGLAALMM